MKLKITFLTLDTHMWHDTSTPSTPPLSTLKLGDETSLAPPAHRVAFDQVSVSDENFLNKPSLYQLVIICDFQGFRDKDDISFI